MSLAPRALQPPAIADTQRPERPGSLDLRALLAFALVLLGLAAVLLLSAWTPS